MVRMNLQGRKGKSEKFNLGNAESGSVLPPFSVSAIGLGSAIRGHAGQSGSSL
jgi:hypothetical protein